MIWIGTVAMRIGMAQVCLPVKRHSEIERKRKHEKKQNRDSQPHKKKKEKEK